MHEKSDPMDSPTRRFDWPHSEKKTSKRLLAFRLTNPAIQRSTEKQKSWSSKSMTTSKNFWFSKYEASTLVARGKNPFEVSLEVLSECPVVNFRTPKLISRELEATF